MKRNCLLTACALLAAVLLCPAWAAAAKKFVVMPFTVNAPQNYSYLGKAVPATIQGRLNRPGVLEGKAIAEKGGAEEARRILAANGADYAIWGVINVVGNDATVEVNSIDKNGKTWTKSSQAEVSRLTGAIQGLTASLGSEALGVQAAARPVFTGGKTPVNQMNQDIVVNETGQQQAYLNPQFRYQGAGAADGSRLRSQRLKFNMVDMAVADFNGDGKNEIAIIDDYDLYIYLWGSDGRLQELAKTRISSANLNFSMRAMDINHDGASDMIIATFEEDGNRPYSYFYSFKGGKLAQIADRAPYFCSVLRTPPAFEPVLVGQGYDSIKLFAPGVRQMVKNGGKFSLGSRISLPAGANVFNCAWIPGSGKNGDLLVMLAENERIKVFQGSMEKPLHSTMESFSGSATGMDHYKGIDGLGIDKKGQLPSKYYAPMRMIAADLGKTGENVIMLNKPISTASQFFERYRFFPQGEIHALYWDGVGMALKWKTRRIRGSVAEIDLADVNNDGVLDLVVGLNTSPELGIGSRQCMVTAYPLDVSQADPNTPADMSDFEVNPDNR